MNSLSAIQTFIRPEPPLPRAELAPSKISSGEIQELPQFITTQPLSPVTEAPASFSNLLTQMVNEVNAKQFAASDAVSGLLTGQGVPLHQAVIAMEEASVSFQLMVEVRNKLLDSYQELMRMQM